MTASRFGAIAIALVSAAGFSIACSRPDMCVRGDMTEFIDPAVREVAGEGFDWMRDAKVCSIGEYRVVGPASGDDPTLFVLKGRKGVFARGAESSMLFKDGLPVVMLGMSGNPDEPSSLSYDIRDGSGDILVTVFDRDLDGQADMRTRSAKGQELIIELWRSDRWRTLVRQEGRPGYMEDGRFVPLTPAETPPSAFPEKVREGT